MCIRDSALVEDTRISLLELCEEMDLPWTVEARTGDTSGVNKTRQRKRLPSCLVTTPESLSVLLSYPDFKKSASELKAIIVDEWHELLSTKRGIQTELCLARLRKWNPRVRTWGLSATLGNLDVAKSALLGSSSRRPCREGEPHRRRRRSPPGCRGRPRSRRTRRAGRASGGRLSLIHI